MRNEYVTAEGENVYECVIKGSRFIAVSGPCGSEDDLNRALSSVKVRYPNATHYCYAAVFNGNDRFSDNGEPSGTAGRPILQVLKGSGIDDVFCIVVRYFGGTLLGTGGLVQAYSDTSSGSVRSLNKVKMVSSRTLRLMMNYQEYNRFMSSCSRFVIGRPEQEFSENVTMTVTVAEYDIEGFDRALADATGGRVKYTIISNGFSPLV